MRFTLGINRFWNSWHISFIYKCYIQTKWLATLHHRSVIGACNTLSEWTDCMYPYSTSDTFFAEITREELHIRSRSLSHNLLADPATYHTGFSLVVHTCNEIDWSERLLSHSKKCIHNLKWRSSASARVGTTKFDQPEERWLLQNPRIKWINSVDKVHANAR